MDVQFRGSNPSLPTPPAIILDYMYGVTAYKHWRSDPHTVHDVMSTYRREQYANIPPLPRPSPAAGEATVGGVDFDDPLDLDYIPTATQEEDGMTQAMDDLNLLLMRVNGITPQELADKREKQMEEEEQVAQEKSRSKVTEWMRTGSTFSPTDLSSNSAYRPGRTYLSGWRP